MEGAGLTHRLGAGGPTQSDGEIAHPGRLTPVIRAAVLGDLDALERLETEAFASDRLSRRSLRYYISAPTAVFLIVEWEARPAGDALVGFRQGSKFARLYSLAVAPGLHGRGLGRALLEASEEAARTRHSIRLKLQVREDNAAAIALYQSAGYRECGREPDFYEDGAPALHFEKTIGPEARLRSRRSRS